MRRNPVPSLPLRQGPRFPPQVPIPFLGTPILPVQNREYVAGLYRVGETALYVNRGVGWLRRVRLFVRPEVTLLRLQPRTV